jgi:hypothetical protein
VGLQLIGNYFGEARLLNAAHQFQQPPTGTPAPRRCRRPDDRPAPPPRPGRLLAGLAGCSAVAAELPGRQPDQGGITERPASGGGPPQADAAAHLR